VRDVVRADGDGRACAAVTDLLSVLSAASVPRSLVPVATAAGLPGRDRRMWGRSRRWQGLTAEAADRVLARLEGASLVTFSVDGPAVTVAAHRLVMRVIRENLAASGLLAGTCQVAARMLDQQAQAMSERLHEDQAAARTLVEQASAVTEAAARCPPDASLDRDMTQLR
jgi:hypothetical protein